MRSASLKILVVGMNPSSYATGNNNRKNHTFDRLQRWMKQVGVDHFSFVNCSSKPGVVTRHDVEYDVLEECLKHHTKVISLGGFASDVLTRLNKSHHRLPHPSPRNRLFNDRSFEPQVVSELKRYVES